MHARLNNHWDIFCRIVDNFGDIGICWRLAQQLQSEHALPIRLWIDDLNVAKQLIPDLDTALTTQIIKNIRIDHWQENSAFDRPATVVIEAFSCTLPPTYVAQMPAHTIWINLEYLSAESWVADFHAQFAIYGTLKRHFFFPGFTAETGGLLREKTDPHAPKLNLQKKSSALSVSLFCYPDAPIPALLEAMANTPQPIICYVPVSSIMPKIAEFFKLKTLNIGDQYPYKNLCVHILPFLSQTDYDQLLAHCDINFVRGEDSWVRAIWAGKAFIWQPYLQTENTHINKLHAFLDFFYSGAKENIKDNIEKIHLSWVNNHLTHSVWQSYLAQLPEIHTLTQKKANMLRQQENLAEKLVAFVKKLNKNTL